MNGTADRTAALMQLLGLARRAGGIAPGTEAVRQSVREGTARAVLLAGDASDVQLDKVMRTMATRPVPTMRVADRKTLGAAVGLAPLSAVAVTNVTLAEQVVAQMDGLLVNDSVAVEG